MINELSALRRIEERFHKASKGVELGIGDDAAALQFDTDKLVLATTDSQVEDVHFVKSLITASELARKAVAVSVSDVGAMGGVPRFILASVGFSEKENEEFLDGLISGFKLSEEEFELELIGGNLSSSNKLFIDITVLGEVEPHLMIKRSGANPGDLIYTSGTLGDSALGLKILQNKEIGYGYEFLINKHLHPVPRLELGRELAINRVPTSMIDISDGILLDLERITVQQGTGAKLELMKLPTSKQYGECIHQYSDDEYGLALSGGEDYELLFTSHEDRRGDIQTISKNLNIQITEIGYVTKDRTIEVLNINGEAAPHPNRGFIHFNN
ncbi:MAG: thiamine-phosphate kinase [Deltaproteobacteria bacterium]|nr:thiamine-phosphate kinase [Deltaproteobacteria bacterium]